jgi:hypothetical protein
MDLAQLLSGFSTKALKDDRVHPTHISMFISLIHHWMMDDFNHPVIICRRELMQMSKIKSKATYHKCIKELQTFGYIIYKPSFNPYKPTEIYFNHCWISPDN